MTRLFLQLPAAGAVTLALSAAQPPAALGQVQSGLWEISGAGAPVRECVADAAALARFEHRSNNCSARILKDSGNLAKIDYSCGGAGFGHSEMTVLTPRSLRIETQGISGGLPFNYVLQAHRIADCSSASRH
jgi:hypothetical protein